MNLFFYMPGCSYCERAAFSVVKENRDLVAGKKIAIVNAYGVDPRRKFLEEKFGTSNPLEWPMPIVMLEKRYPKKIFNSYMRNYGFRSLFHGIFTEDHHVGVVEGYLHKHLEG